MSNQTEIARLTVLAKELAAGLAALQDTPTPPGPIATALTTVKIQSTSEENQENVPFTFGQVFKVGALAKADTLTARAHDMIVAIQVDVKALHDDGSVRHAIVSGILPILLAGATVELPLVVAPSKTSGQRAFKVPRVKVSAFIAGTEYTADPGETIKLGTPRKWLQGAMVDETLVSIPLQDKLRNPHPHLHARFAIRAYANGKTRVDVTVENDWAYEPNPQNFLYDAAIEIDGVKVYQKSNLNHLHHARWRKMFWSGAEPQIHIMHDTAYLIDTMAVPNYDQTLTVPEKTLAGYDARWKKAGDEPMTVGLAMKAMGTTGGREDIGLNPGWTVTALLTNDKRVMDATIGTATLAGSWAMHYRDKNTDQPISLIDYPYMTILGNPGDTRNPVTKEREVFPTLSKKENPTPHSHDISHQPNFAYVPYLLTGDFYHLEELQFWAMYDVFSSNPGYRQNIKGLLNPEQVRGQAWALRTLAEAAYITPDDDRLKEHFTRVLNFNLDWYVENYAPGGKLHNPLGVLTNGYAVVYANKTAVAPWQDDFFTSAVGHAAELHPNSRAKELLDIKVKFVEERLLGKGANWLAAANYTYPVRATADGPIFTIGEAYATLRAGVDPVKDLAEIKRLDGGGNNMGGYPTSTAGYPANMQPAVSFASDAAWQQFEKRDPKPNYGTSPQFAIVPRK